MSDVPALYCIYRLDCLVSGKAYIGLTETGAAKRAANG